MALYRSPGNPVVTGIAAETAGHTIASVDQMTISLALSRKGQAAEQQSRERAPAGQMPRKEIATHYIVTIRSTLSADTRRPLQPLQYPTTLGF